MPAANDSPSSSRALVALAPEHFERHSQQRTQRAASFVAQLIASARQVPQARAKRRAEAAEVIAAYRDTVARIQRLNEKSE